MTQQTGNVGRLVDRCAIDLPPDDVVQRIEFERFFRLNLAFRDLQGPATLGIVAPTPPTPRRVTGGAASIDRPLAPLSAEAAEWNSFDAATRRANSVLAQASAQSAVADHVRGLPLAFYLPFVQSWRLDGYSQGRLVNSFTLAPAEQQTIEIFTWDRRRTSLESTSTTEIEETTESSGSRRDANDVATDIARQAGFEMTTGGKVGFSVGVVNADLNAGLSARTQLNDAEKDTRSQVVEATTKSSNRIRNSRTLTVSESREFGREERVTRTLRNPSDCHTLTMPFFEILASYSVETVLDVDAIKLVVLIPSDDLTSIGTFDTLSVRTYESVLRRVLLEPGLAAGIDAAKMLDARRRACSLLCEGCDCDDASDVPGAATEWAAVSTAATAIGTAVTTLRTEAVGFPLTLPAAVLNDPAAVKDVKRFLMWLHLGVHASKLVGDLEGIVLGATVTPAQVDRVAAVLAGVSPEVRAKLITDSDPRDFWTIHATAMTITHEFFSALIATEKVKANTGGFAADDAGLLAAIAAFDAAYQNWTRAAKAAQAANEKLAELARIAKEEREQRILQAFGLREVAEAEERLEALLDHLNNSANLDHYRFAVWASVSGGVDNFVTSLALAGYVEATPVGVVQNQLAVPLKIVPGQLLAQFYDDSLADLRETIPATSDSVIMTTAALYLEAVVGECCSCSPSSRRLQDLELDRRKLENELLEVELERLRARLGAKPPVLDAPSGLPGPLQVDVTTHAGGPAAAAT